MKIPFKFNLIRTLRGHPDLGDNSSNPLSFGKDEGGATAVEFAFVFPAFIALVFFVMQSAFTYWTHHTLDFGVHETARLVRTGQVTNASLTKQKFKETICGYVSLSKVECMSKLAIELRPMPVSPDYSPPMKDGEMNDENAPYDSGGSSTLMMLKAFLPADHLNWVQDVIENVPGATQSTKPDIVLRSVALFRNEPF